MCTDDVETVLKKSSLHRIQLARAPCRVAAKLDQDGGSAAVSEFIDECGEALNAAELWLGTPARSDLPVLRADQQEGQR